MNKALNAHPRSDAEWYLRRAAEKKIFYDLFFLFAGNIKFAGPARQHRKKPSLRKSHG